LRINWSWDPEASEPPPDYEDKHDLIIIGSSIANAPLAKLEREQPEFFASLPYWFNRINYYGTQGVMILDGGADRRFSACDWLYYKEAPLPADNDRELKSDLAIVARFTVPNGPKVLVLAGIHQIGTWIAASFMEGIFNTRAEELSRRQKVLYSNEDCVALVSGKLSTRTLEVSDPLIERIYTLQGANWRMISD